MFCPSANRPDAHQGVFDSEDRSLDRAAVLPIHRLAPGARYNPGHWKGRAASVHATHSKVRCAPASRCGLLLLWLAYITEKFFLLEITMKKAPRTESALMVRPTGLIPATPPNLEGVLPKTTGALVYRWSGWRDLHRSYQGLQPLCLWKLGHTHYFSIRRNSCSSRVCVPYFLAPSTLLAPGFSPITR